MQAYPGHAHAPGFIIIIIRIIIIIIIIIIIYENLQLAHVVKH